MSTKALGDQGEDLTGDYLLARGCTLLDRQWRCRYGEREKLRAAAACYLSQHDLDAPARFDVAEIYTDEAHRPLRLEYLEDAFT